MPRRGCIHQQAVCDHLDALGNWAGTTIGATSQTREHNAANEVTSVSGTWADPAYDTAGNMTSGPKAGDEATRLHYRYDAWNRMTAAHADNSGQPGTVIASYEYDGQGRRIEKLVSGGDDLDYYLSEQNQVLEVRADDAPYASEQYVWDIRYVDGLILRDVAGDEQGDLDETFGDDGVILGGPGDIGAAEQVIVQRDGKVVVMDASAGLVRYNADGSLDTGFGDADGQQRTGWTRLAVSGWYLGSAGVEELPDGKLLVGGCAWNESDDSVLLLARWNADGSLDTSFGDNGFELIDVSQTLYEVSNAMSVQSDGKVILTGSLYDGLTDSLEAMLVRLMEDPQDPGHFIFDPSFAGDGVALLDAGEYTEAWDAKVDSEGRIVVAGPVDNQWWAARYTTGGDLDTSFGTVSGQERTGWRTVDFAGSGYEQFSGVELYPDGRVLLGGYKANNAILARLTEAGDYDASFSGDGQTTLGGVYAECAYDLALQADGKIVVAGLWFANYPASNYEVLAGRVNADGTMDSSFGDGGWTRFDLTGVNFNGEYAVSLAVQADGKVVLAGRVDYGGETELFVARLSGLTRHYAMQDANWNLTGIVDPTTGQAVEHYVFTPYGGRTVLDSAFESRSASSFGWIVGHQGLAVDVETGLVYNRARYLDTSMGRFTIRDLIGYADGMSLYLYEHSAPMSVVDPSGLKWGSVKDYFHDYRNRDRTTRQQFQEYSEALEMLRQMERVSLVIYNSDERANDYGFFAQALRKPVVYSNFLVLPDQAPNAIERWKRGRMVKEHRTFEPDTDHCQIVLYLGHALDTPIRPDDSVFERFGLRVPTSREIPLPRDDGHWDYGSVPIPCRPTVGVASCFASATLENAEKHGYHVLPSAVASNEVVFGTPPELLKGKKNWKSSNYTLLQTTTTLLRDARNKAQKLLDPNAKCPCDQVTIEVIYGFHYW